MQADATRYRQTVDLHGLSPTHRRVIDWVADGSSVLELGCSSGYVGEALIHHKHCRVTGVEVDPAAAVEARGRGLTVIEGSLEDEAFRRSMSDRFDVVIAADVLEHLTAPDRVLADIRRWVAPTGSVILAVPNIATWSVRYKLFFRGQFDYEETGIMDRSHVHFFTWNNFHALLRGHGWVVCDTMVDGGEIPGLQHLLHTWPHAFFAPALQRWNAGQARRGDFFLCSIGTVLIKLGQSLSRTLVRIVPNLVAPHVAVLLSPPMDPQ
jgi:methionine biosynthesis protein MetW